VPLSPDISQLLQRSSGEELVLQLLKVCTSQYALLLVSPARIHKLPAAAACLTRDSELAGRAWTVSV